MNGECYRRRLLAHLYITVPIVLTIAMAATSPTATQAAIFKCVDASGNTTYSGTECPPAESTQRISKTATALPGLDCRIARKLAHTTTRRMKAGESSDSLLESFGRIDSLSTFTINLVSYVYSFEGNHNLSANRIATLATERCQVSAFGSDAASCAAYPSSFIQELGGCATAPSDKGENHEETRRQQLAERYLKTTGGETAAYEPPELAEARPSATPTPTNRQKSACLLRVSKDIESIQMLMKSAHSTSAQDSLRIKVQQLKQQLRECG